MQTLEINGRGERIRTSGPCLQKTLRLYGSRGFPVSQRFGAAHMGAHVPMVFAPEVHGELSTPVCRPSRGEARP